VIRGLEFLKVNKKPRKKELINDKKKDSLKWVIKLH
jgi:hypothetical protein